MNKTPVFNIFGFHSVAFKKRIHVCGDFDHISLEPLILNELIFRVG